MKAKHGDKISFHSYFMNRQLNYDGETKNTSIINDNERKTKKKDR